MPILLGVIVLGFVIGAGLSLAGRRGTSDVTTVAVASATPLATLAPVTPAPTEKPTREPTEAPTERSTEAATEEPTTESTTAVTATPRRASSKASPAKAAPVAAASAQPAAPATAAPAAAATAHSSLPGRVIPPPPPPLTAASPRPALGTPAASTQDVSVAGDFPKLAAAVVRQYLVAVERGDMDAAYSALGASPGDRGVQLTESGLLDPHTKISHIESHGIGDSATVNVDLQTPDGPYYGTYTVHRNDTGAAIIVDHSLAKP